MPREPLQAAQRVGTAREANSSWAIGGQVSSRPTGASRLPTAVAGAQRARCGPLRCQQLKQGLARV